MIRVESAWAHVSQYLQKRLIRRYIITWGLTHHFAIFSTSSPFPAQRQWYQVLQLSHSIQFSFREPFINSFVAGVHDGQLSSLPCWGCIFSGDSERLGDISGDFGALRVERRLLGAIYKAVIYRVTLSHVTILTGAYIPACPIDLNSFFKSLKDHKALIRLAFTHKFTAMDNSAGI